MDKEKRKKFAVAAIIFLLVILESLAALRLALSVAYPERVLREIVAEYYMQSLDKAVKFESVSFDHLGNLVITGLDISITSDFNDNISLVRCRKSVVDLAFFPLAAGRVTVREIDLYDPAITLIKRYGKTYRESLQQTIDIGKFFSHIKKSGGGFSLYISNATVEYRESLSDRMVIVRFDDVSGSLSLAEASLSYRLKGKIRRHRTEIIRRGDFTCSGSIDIPEMNSYRHSIAVNNFDLSYLNDHIVENRWAAVFLEGGGSITMEIVGSKGQVILKGTVETNSLTVTDNEEKFHYISNENLNLDIDMTIARGAREFTVRGMRLHDGVFSIEASGLYTRDEKDHRLEFRFNTNRTDLEDLSETITPFRDYNYSGFLQCDGAMKIDFTRKEARGMALNLVLDEFTVTKHVKGDSVMVMDSSSARITMKDDALNASLELKPLGSDCSIKSASKISGWIPFKSETEVSVHSRRMNLRALGVSLAAICDSVYGSAYEDRGGPVEGSSFTESYFGKFLFHNTINLRSTFDAVFFGRKAVWKNCIAEMNLARGTLLLSNFEIEGYGARYALALQGYFNSEMPYMKIDGRVDDFNVTDFYSESGMKGVLTGTARADFGYEVSAARMSDILNNSKGRYSFTISSGEMKDTVFQVRLADFLKKNGYVVGPLENISFSSLSLAGTQQGENFWISGLGIQGDELISNCFGDYQYSRGIRCTCRASIRGDGSTITVPFQLRGRLAVPCIAISGKEKAAEICF